MKGWWEKLLNLLNENNKVKTELESKGIECKQTFDILEIKKPNLAKHFEENGFCIDNHETTRIAQNPVNLVSADTIIQLIA